MSLRRFIACATLCIAATGCDTGPAEARADLFATDGRRLGTATFRPVSEGVLVTIDASDLPPGEHAVHIHETGDCSSGDFSSAGGHFDPAGNEHGLADRTADGAHAGDLVNLVVDDAGTVVAHRVVKGANLLPRAAESSASLLRSGGTALVIHAKPDDYRTDPAGAAGPRIACGVVSLPS